MPGINLTIIVLFSVTTIIFAYQNLEFVTMSFLDFTLRAHMAIVIFVVYVLGTAAGGSPFALLRRSYQGPRPPIWF